MADDWGCFNADPDVIKGLAYPKRKETAKQIIKIRDTFHHAGMLFIWIDKNLRTWGFFINWEKHEYIGGTEYNRQGERTRHRRRTPEPPTEELTKYLESHILEHLGTFGSGLEQTASNPNPNPNPNPVSCRPENEATADNPTKTTSLTTDIKEWMAYYNAVLKNKGWIKRDLSLTHLRRRLIESRLKDNSLTDLKVCADNFARDTWEDRHKYIDPKYCIGIIGGRDLLERWLNADVKKKSGWDK